MAVDKTKQVSVEPLRKFSCSFFCFWFFLLAGQQGACHVCSSCMAANKKKKKTIWTGAPQRNATEKTKHHPSFQKCRPHEPFRHGQSEWKYLGYQPPDHPSATKFFHNPAVRYLLRCQSVASRSARTRTTVRKPTLKINYKLYIPMFSESACPTNQTYQIVTCQIHVSRSNR